MTSEASSDCGSELMLQEKFNKLKSMYIRDKKSLEGAKQSEKILKEEIAQLNKSLDKLRSNLSSLELDNKALMQRSGDLEAELTMYEKISISNKELSEKNEQLKSKCDELSKNYSKLHHMETTIQSKLPMATESNIEAVLGDLLKDQLELSAYKNRIHDMSVKLSLLEEKENDNEVHSEKINELEIKLDEQMSHNAELREEIKRIQDELNFPVIDKSVSNESDNLKSTNVFGVQAEFIEECTEKSIEENNELRLKVASLENQLESERNSFKCKLSAIEKDNSTLKSTKDELDNLNLELDDLRIKLVEQQETHSNQLGKVEQRLQFQVQDYTRLIAEKETEIGQLREAIDKLSDENEHIPTLKDSMTELQTSLTAVEAYVISISNLLLTNDSDSSVDVFGISPSQDTLIQELMSLQRSIRKHISINREAELELEDVKCQLREAEGSTKQRMNVLDLEVGEYAKTSSELKSLVSAKETEIKDLNEVINSNGTKIDELTKEIVELKDKNTKMIQLLKRLKKENLDKDIAINTTKDEEVAVRKKLDSLAEEMKHIKSKSSDTNAIIESLQGSVDSLTEELKMKSSQFEKSVESITVQRDSFRTKYESILSEFNEYKVKVSN